MLTKIGVYQMITTIKKIKPMFNGVVTTMNKYGNEYLKGTTMLDPTKSGTVKEYQTVVAVGPIVRGIEPGDVVYINPKRYAIMEHKEGSMHDGVIKDNPVIGYKFDIVEIEGVPHLYLADNDIKYVAEVEEFEENPSIVVPDAPKIDLSI